MEKEKISEMEKEKNSERSLGEIFVEEFDIPPHYIQEILEKQRRTKKRFGEIAIETGLINEDIVYHAISIQKNVRYIPSIEAKNSFQPLNILNQEEFFLKKFDRQELINNILESHIFPARYEEDPDDREKKKLIFATDDIDGVKDNLSTLMLLEDIKHRLKEYNRENPDSQLSDNLELVLVAPSVFRDRMELPYKSISEEELRDFATRTTSDENLLNRGDGKYIDIETFLRMIFTYAIAVEASDIHIEPSTNGQARLSIRRQGFRKTIDFLDLSLSTSLISLIKSRANMQSLSTIAQDGTFTGEGFLTNYKLPIKRGLPGKKNENPEFDFSNISFRVSTYPTVKPTSGDPDMSYESTVLRVLYSERGQTALESLGLSDQVVKELSFVMNRNQGICIISGPTGSGKSTTLYSTLSKIDAVKKKIISFEDPVEMRNMYWAQAERRLTDSEAINFDFQHAKKAILRQDPDVILMGEVRDESSAFFALEAANTGHLMFTTIHANSAAATVERLLKLGIKPLELASALLSIISQRLVRAVCPHCKIETEIDQETIEFLKRLEFDEKLIPEKITKASKTGCSRCGGAGYIGRTLIDEIIPINSRIRQLITDSAPEFEIRKAANEMGYKTMLENGLEKVKKGITTIDEVLRVI